MAIYERAMASLILEGLLSPADKVLVACGGDTDARALQAHHFTDALITNLDSRRRAGIGIYRWQRADAEALPFPDNSFDWGMVHAGLHHCASPHRGLLELARVCRKGILVVEARDSLIMRLAVRLGLTSDYEIEAVALDSSGGGLRDTRVPNFIYRWTEREVRKTIEAAHPDRQNDFRFFYGLNLPVERMTMCGAGKRLAAIGAGWLARALFRIAPKQGNQFAFAILKTGRDKPWISRGNDAELDPSFALAFDPKRYIKEAA